MICSSSGPFFQLPNPVPISFNEWKHIISGTKTKSPPKLSSNDSHCRTTTQINKHERPILPRNQVFGDTVADSFLASSSNLAQSSTIITRPGKSDTNVVGACLVSPPKRYVSSFKTLITSTNSKQTHRFNHLNDNVMILKLPKENASENSIAGSQLSSKHSTLSMATTATIMSNKLQNQLFSPANLSPILKVEGQKRRIAQHDSPVTVSSTVDTSVGSNPTNHMAMSTSGHPQANSSAFSYRSAATGGNTLRQRAIPETTPNSLLIATERLKSNISSSIRPARQLLPPPTTLSSTYIPSQQTQRANNQNTKSRGQQEKIANSKDTYDYPDPFTNCPQEILSKLSQLTKLQMDTIEWEKKRKFIKKKPLANGTSQGKDSP